MGLRDELFELLIQLPAVDVAAERKSLLLAAGYSRLGPYLDLDGSTVEFMAGLLEELGRRGQPVLTGFVAALPAAPQVDSGRRDRLAGLRAQLEALDEAAFGAEFGVVPAEAGEPPYKGLDLYDVADAPLFFGREKLTSELVAHLREHSLLVVVGRSGSGKSSLVRAGVAAALQAGTVLEGEVLPPLGSSAWPRTIVTPTSTPLETLARALVGDGPPARELMEAMRGDGAALRGHLERTAGEGGERRLLVVDQLEELFTLCKDDAERRAYLDNLLDACGLAAGQTEEGSPAVVILALRADFYAACLHYPALGAALETHLHNVGAMSRDELRRTIEQPARKLGWQLEQGLVDTILEDVGDEPGALPLLSHALSQTWERRSGRLLTLAGYRSAGGVREAIARTAQRVYGGFSEQEQAIARRIFLRLVDPAQEDRATRRREARATLAPEADSPEGRVLLELSSPDARLLTVDGEEVQLAHEALIHNWTQLADWVHARWSDLQLREGLIDAARAWQAAPPAEQDNLLIHRGGRLEDAVRLVEGGEVACSPQEQAYVAACAALRDREAEAGRRLQEERVRTAEQLAARRRQMRQRTIAAAIIGLVALVAMVLAVLFFRASQAAEANEATAVAARNLEAVARATSQANEAEALAAKNLEAIARATSQADAATAVAARDQEAAAHATAEAARAQVERLSLGMRADALTTNALNELDKALKGLDPDPPLAILLAVEGLRAQYDVTATQPVTGGTAPAHEVVVGLAQSNVHSLLIQVGGVPLVGHGGTVAAVAFSPDGRYLVTAAGDRTALLWLLESGLAEPGGPQAKSEELRGHGRGINAVAFSSDGRWLVTASADGTADLWDMEDPQAEPAVLEGHEDVLTAAAFSPAGDWLATASRDNTARLWPVPGNGFEPVVLRGHRDRVTAAAFSPDGRHLATASEDRTARVWDTADPQTAPAVLTGHEGSVTALAFSPDGRWLATASADATARLWDAEDLPWTAEGGQAEPVVLRGHTRRVGALAFSPDGRWLATASDDGTACVWGIESLSGTAEGGPAGPTLLQGHAGPVTALGFSPDGRQLATASDDGTVRLWPMPGNPVKGAVLYGHAAGVTAVAFSGDGRWLATASRDGSARLWSAVSPQAEPTVLRGHTDDVRGVVFGPDGDWLGTASRDGTARLWPLPGNQAEPVVFSGHTGAVNALALSPDGHWLATASGDRTARLWDLEDPQAEPSVLQGHELAVSAVAFGPDGRTLATGSRDGTARLWDVTNPQEAPAVFRGHTDWVNSVAFSPDGRYLATASYDFTVRLWDADDPQSAPLILPARKDAFTAVAFSPDGRHLAGTSDDGTARLWDLGIAPWTAEGGQAEPAVLRGHTQAVNAAAFSPDGRWLATASDDGTARLWYVADPQADPVVFQGYAGPLTAVAFSPDGRWLATASNDDQDYTARLWTWRVEDLLDLACRTSGRNLTSGEWARYMSGMDYRPTCPQWPAGE